jgi:flavin reductase (DIM6/NTAB) family NADH-FMN oxidoreductase RutF
MGKKKSIPVKAFWFSDVLVIPKLVTIITTIDEQGRVNAAPYSLGTTYNVGKKQPQILMGVRRATHTFRNIAATGEFVINFPSWEHLHDIMQTARFWPAGVDELQFTKFEPEPSNTVKPPSISQCRQHIECRLHKVLEVDEIQSFVLGDILDIVADEELIPLRRGERIRAIDLPVYMGDEKKRYYYYGRIGEIEMRELLPPEKRGEYEKVFTMQWDSAAQDEFYKIPENVQAVVVEFIEEIARNKGAQSMTHELFIDIVDQYAPPEFRERFG